MENPRFKNALAYPSSRLTHGVEKWESLRMLTSWIFNLALLAIEVALLRARAGKRQDPALRPDLLRLAGMVVVAGILAALLGLDRFGVLRLLAWAIFLHGTALAAFEGWRFWPQRRLLACASLTLAIALPMIAFYAFRVEPFRLEITTHRISAPGLSKSIKVVLIADLQADRIGNYERRVLTQAMEQQPDLVLLAGDYVQLSPGPDLKATQRELNAYLREIGFGAPMGVFAVEGNVDPHGWQAAFDGLNVQTVRTTSIFDLGEVHLTALSLADSFDQSLALPAAQGDALHLVLGHGPDFALSPSVHADLLLAGHIHGGQVQVPGFGPLVTLSAVPRTWATGLTKIGSGTSLVVSRGVGMERGRAPRLRFFCRPELVVLELKPLRPPLGAQQAGVPGAGTR